MGFWDVFRGNSEKSKKRGDKASHSSLPAQIASPFASIEVRVVSAFTRVKQDITLISSWVKYLRHKDMMNEQRHTHAQRELGIHQTLIFGLQSEANDLKKSIHELREELKATKEAQIRAEHTENKFVSELNPDLIRTKSELNPDRKRTNFENKVVSMLRSRKKDYVLKQILDLAGIGNHSTREIEEVVVGERGLCGRTAFYDYLRELKHKKMIMQGEKGTKKVILLHQ
jgi:hypothetical protein